MAKTTTVTKTTTKGLKALMQTPIGGSTTAPVQTPKAVTKGKGKTLYSFEMTPLGDTLRAYFIGLITAQCGGLKEGATFRLWPAANLRTHLANSRVKRAGEGLYALTAQGVSYFKLPDQEPDKELLAQMVKAVTTGEPPKCYSRKLVPLK